MLLMDAYIVIVKLHSNFLVDLQDFFDPTDNEILLKKWSASNIRKKYFVDQNRIYQEKALKLVLERRF